MKNQISNVKKTPLLVWVWKGRKGLWFNLNPPCKTIILHWLIIKEVFKYLFYSNTYFIQILILFKYLFIIQILILFKYLFYSNTYFIQILILFKYLFYSNTYLLFKYLFYSNTYFIQILIYYSNTYFIQILIFIYYSNT